jgi:hypothetical protein
LPRRQNHGAVEEPQRWNASVALHLSGVEAAEQQSWCGLAIDRVHLPVDVKARGRRRALLQQIDPVVSSMSLCRAACGQL